MRNIPTPAFYFFAVALAFAAAGVPAGAAPFDEVASKTGLSPTEKDRLLSGQMVFKSSSKTKPNQLFLSCFFILDSTLAEFQKEIRAGRIINTSQSALAASGVVTNLTAGDIDLVIGKSFTPEEAARYKNASPGVSLNLSKDEIALFNAVTPDGLKLDAAIAPVLAKILQTRLGNYRMSGITAIAPYARENTESFPDREILYATEMIPRLFEHIPEIKQIVSAFPAETHGMEQFFQISCQKIEGRPDYILSHFSFIQPRENSFLAISRQFYVSHSYNTLLIVVGAVETDKGLLVFYYNSTFTDMITGFIGNVKKSVGQSQMRGDVTTQLQNFRKSFK